MKPLKVYDVSLSVYEYRFSATLGEEQLEDALTKLTQRVLKLTEQETAFFDLPSVLETASEMERDESTCFQVSKSRAFTLNIKRII